MLTIRLFYLTTEGLDGGRVLQNDLDNLSVWESRWDMEFNPSKCQVVRVPPGDQLTLCATYMDRSVKLWPALDTWGWYLCLSVLECPYRQNNRKCQPYLGLSEKKHKNKTPQGERDCLQHFCTSPTGACGPVWDPHTKENILQTEKKQRRAARWTTRSSVTECWKISAGGYWNKDWQMLVYPSSMASCMDLWQFPCQIISSPKPDCLEIATNCQSVMSILKYFSELLQIFILSSGHNSVECLAWVRFMSVNPWCVQGSSW